MSRRGLRCARSPLGTLLRSARSVSHVRSRQVLLDDDVSIFPSHDLAEGLLRLFVPRDGKKWFEYARTASYSLGSRRTIVVQSVSGHSQRNGIRSIGSSYSAALA